MQYPLQSQLVLKYCCCLGEMIIWSLRARVNLDSDLQMQKMHYLGSFSPCLLHAGMFCNAHGVSGPVSNFMSPGLAAGSLSSEGEALTNKTVPGLGSAGAPAPVSAIFSIRPVTAVHSLSSHGALS